MDRDTRDPDEQQIADVWQMLDQIPPEPANTDAMRARFDVAVHAEQVRMRWQAARWALTAAAAIALLASGVLIGRRTAPPPAPDASLIALRQELHEMRQMVTLSLLQQQSATERLKGVTFTSQIDRPGTEIVSALLDTLIHDPNVNVRLASIDALKRFSDRPEVRRVAVDGLTHQSSPLVQIALIDLMVELNDRDAVDTLQQLSRDERVNEAVRQRATWGLQRIG